MKSQFVVTIFFSFTSLLGAEAFAKTADLACQDTVKKKTISAWADTIDSPAGPIFTVAKVKRISLTGSSAVYSATEFWNDDLIVGASATVKAEMTEDGCRVTSFSIHE
jgi:hypothetical protein